MKIPEEVALHAKGVILLLKAGGGYKYRSWFKMSDVEFAEKLKYVENDVFYSLIKLDIAERLMQKPRGVISGDLWQEYQAELKKFEK